jgi:hypothetical protein
MKEETIIESIFGRGWKIKLVSNKTLEKYRCDSLYFDILNHPCMWDRKHLENIEYVFDMKILGYLPYRREVIKLK